MGLGRILGKWLGKKIGAKAGVGKSVGGVTFTGFHPVPPKATPFNEKIKDLATDKGLCEDYVSDLINATKSNKSLYPIKKYLESSRNDLPYNVTKKMLSRIAKKIDALKQEFAESVDADHIFGWLL